VTSTLLPFAVLFAMRNPLFDVIIFAIICCTECEK
jgi:hypothetical protein